MNLKLQLILCLGLTLVNTQTQTIRENFSSLISGDNFLTNVLRKNLSKYFSINYKQFTLLKNYDYIIVGSGPAGCVLANRLSENPDVTVLLLEAGKPELSIVTDVPLGSPNLQSTSYNWGYQTEPQKKACLSMNENRCQWPHGRGLGGSTIINYMIYTRGNRRDFDSWSKAGNDGWSYDEVLPYFIKSEKSNLREYSNNGFHGHDGPLNVEDIPYRSPIAEAFVKSAQEFGFPYVDQNAKEQIGVSFAQSFTKNGWRFSAAESYLNDVRNRPNLHISPQSWVTKIIIKSKTQTTNNLKIKGVTFLRNRKEYYVKANREVILSAGAFESPKLLMLSGIGPAKHLHELGINLVKDLPVGETLYEHISVFGPIYTGENINDGLVNINNVITSDTISQYYLGKGPLTTNGIESILFLKTNASEEVDDKLPDIELMQAIGTVAFDTAQGTRLGLGLSTDAYNSIFKPIENKRAFLFLPMLLHPKSKGFLKLKSKNPFHHPLFYPNFFDDEHDIETLISGIRAAMEIASQKSFQELKLKLYGPKIPGCEGIIFNSDEYWRCYIMHLSATLHHQVATCKMGPKTDPTSVVDSKLFVHGFKNLRVADISIIPQPPSGHTSAYSFMIGEKTADLINEKWIADDLQRVGFGIRKKRNLKQFDWQHDEEFDGTKGSHKIDSGHVYTKIKTMNKTLDYTTSTTTTVIPEILSTISPVESIRNILRAHEDELNKPKFVLPFVNITNGVQNTTKIYNISHYEIMSENNPSANEDAIRTYTLKNDSAYGRGKNKARYITMELSKMNSTDYNNTTTPTVNNNELNNSTVTSNYSLISISTKKPIILRKKREFLDKESISRITEMRKLVSNSWKTFNQGVVKTSEFFRSFVNLANDNKN